MVLLPLSAESGAFGHRNLIIGSRGFFDLALVVQLIRLVPGSRAARGPEAEVPSWANNVKYYRSSNPSRCPSVLARADELIE